MSRTHTLAQRGLVIVVPAPSRSLKSWDGQTFACNALHARYRRRHSPCDAVTNTNGSGEGGKVVQLQNWTDTKVPTLDGNGQPALPVSAELIGRGERIRTSDLTVPN